MKLDIKMMTIGPLDNNVFFLADEDTKDCVVIDPSFEPDKQLEAISSQGWKLSQVWLTHGHYDHTAGAKQISESFNPPLPIAMHPDCFAWASAEPNVVKFGYEIQAVPRVDIPLEQGLLLAVSPGSELKPVEVRDVSGHNPGSVLFYVPELKVAIVGDAIFRESIGRTDFPGSNHELLLKNIREQVFTLPDDTILLPGHGPSTTVAHEKKYNPFLRV